MTARSAIANLAQGWLHVPFRDEGRTRGGVDCVGLVIAVGIEAGLVPEGFDPGPYPRDPDGTLLRRVRTAGMLPLGRAPRTGSVAIFGWGAAGPARHAGIVTDAARGHFVHACSLRGRVVAGVLGCGGAGTARVVAAFDFPGVAE